MRRRDFIGGIYGAALALSCGAAAQQAGKVWRIGHVLIVPPEQGEPFARAVEQSLADLGYVQGRNIVLLHRFAGAQVDKLEGAIISLVPRTATRLRASERPPTPSAYRGCAFRNAVKGGEHG
jgi:putative ABC transport system substrate-binding protein